MYDLTDGAKEKSALLIVNQRYTSQLAPFVKNSKARLSYVDVQLRQMIDTACEETGADFDQVLAAFTEHLSDVLDAVLKNPGNAKREELTQPNADEPYAKNLAPNSNEGLESIVDADVLDRGDVAGAGRVEALEPDARVDLNAETAEEGGSTEVEHVTSSTNCFRCGKIIEKTASLSPVCSTCNAELLRVAYPSNLDGDQSGGWGAAAPAPGIQETPAVNPNMPYSCTICGREGSADEIRSHINNDHADVLQRQDANSTENMGQDNLGIPESLSSWRMADVPRDDDAAQVDPLPQNPGDRFDDYVQRLAETAAARKFSQLSDEDIHSIASQVGASPDDVKNSAVCVAVFGDNVAVNGQLGGDPSPPDGYEEIAAQGLSGQQPTHDALVPTDLVVASVADEMNMSQDLAYNMIKDKYGDDLPDKYHASISGQVHYYLPTELAGNQQQQPQQQQTAPAAQPAPQQQPTQPLAPTQ